MRAFLGLTFPIVISMMLAQWLPIASDYIYFIGGCFSFGLMNIATGNLCFHRTLKQRV